MEAYCWESRVVFISHSSNVFELTLIFMQIGGIEGIHVALHEVFPMQIQWDSSSENLLHFLDLLCVFKQG